MKKVMIVSLCLLLVIVALPVMASEAEDWLELTVNTQEEADALYTQYADVFNHGDAQIVIKGENDVFMPFLKRFQFTSLALDTPAIYGNGISVTELENLTELRCNAASAIDDMANLKALTLRFDQTDNNVRISEIGSMAPNLEKLTLSFSSSKGYNVSFYDACVWPDSLKEVVVTMDGEPVLPQNAAIGSVIAISKAVNPEATVNGMPVSQLDELAGLTEEESVQVRQVDAEAVMTNYLRQVETGALNVLSGEPVIKGKLVILAYDEAALFNLSVEDALNGSDFYGVPNEVLAPGMDEAQTAVIVYSEYRKDGTYTNGTIAYGCATMVAVIDLDTGGMYEAYEAAYDGPASQIKGYESGAGSIQPQEALADLLTKMAD